MTISHEQELLNDVLRYRDVKILAQILRVAKKSIYRWIDGECKPHTESYKKLLELKISDVEKNRTARRP